MRRPSPRTMQDRTNLYPVGFAPVPSSLVRCCEGKGLQGDGTNLDPRRVSAKPAHGHPSTLDSCVPPTRFRLLAPFRYAFRTAPVRTTPNSRYRPRPTSSLLASATTP